MAIKDFIGLGGFLTDNKGNNSSMRLMCAIALAASIVFSSNVFSQVKNSDEAKLKDQQKFIELLSKEMEKQKKDQNLESVTSSIMNLQQLNESEKGTEGLQIIWAFLGAAFGGKIGQKFAEKDSETTGNGTEEGEPGAGP